MLAFFHLPPKKQREEFTKMKNYKSNKPPIGVIVSRDDFNSLISVLSFFISAETQLGENYYSSRAAELREKIMRHGRIFENENGENVSVYFYENESAILLKAMIKYTNLCENPTSDYFAELKKRKRGLGSPQLRSSNNPHTAVSQEAQRSGAVCLASRETACGTDIG